MAKRGRKPKHRINFKAHESAIQSGFSLLLLVLGVISILAIFTGANGGGTVNSKLRAIMVDEFGLSSFLVSVILIYGGFLSIGSIRNRFIKTRIFAGLVLMLLSVLGVLGSGAGTVGAFIQQKSGSLISVPGTVFAFFALFVFSVVLITDIGIDEFIRRIQNVFVFVRVKLLRLEMPANPGEIEINEGITQEDTDESLEVGKQFAIEGSVEEDEKKLNIAELIGKKGAIDEKQGGDFELVHPPSGPVDNKSGLFGVRSNGNEDEVIQDGSKKTSTQILEHREPKKEDKKSLSRLPFTNKVWEYPPVSLLSGTSNQEANAGNVKERAKMIEDTLKAFDVKASLADIHIGPAVTRYALNLSIGTKASKVQSLSTDLALRLKSPSGSVRVEAPIPGTNLVGIEIPNFSPSLVTLRSILESDEMKKAKSRLTISLGHDVAGKPIIQDIARWPHALIAGATGSGKSVMLNSLITTLLFRCSPSECRFIMIDPKMVELSLYNGIPHLLTPVVTDIEQKAVSAFAWAVNEMERRYKLFVNAGVRNIESYNKLSGFQAEPFIVIIVDEIADMMMVAASELEKYIIRLAQKSRATGIHLILATQRPSVNILTGTIKANIPTRIAFKVTSQVDSRVIIDQVGAETLIGRGDMLFVPPDESKPRRVQGVWVSDDEIKELVNFLKKTGLEPEYHEEIVKQEVGSVKPNGSIEGLSDEKMVKALELIIFDGKASASYLQRKLSIGYSRAARMIDDLEAVGIIGQKRGSKPREVIVSNIEEAINRLKGVKSD